jgi:hypothetical protein
MKRARQYRQRNPPIAGRTGAGDPPSEDELAAHAERLAAIAKSAGGPAMWQVLTEPAAADRAHARGSGLSPRDCVSTFYPEETICPSEVAA